MQKVTENKLWWFGIVGGQSDFAIRDPGWKTELISFEQQLDVWQLITVVRTSTSLKLYVDGVFVNEVPSVVDIPNWEADVIFGYYQQGPSDVGYFDGSAFSLSIWNKALGPDEVAEIATATLTGSEPDLVGHWIFGDAAGNMLSDKTLGGIDGTVHGATLVSDCPDIEGVGK
jgi:hypothetical protein